MSDPRDDRAPADQERERGANSEGATPTRDPDEPGEEATTETPDDGKPADGPSESGTEAPDDRESDDRVDRDSGADDRVDRPVRTRETKRQSDDVREGRQDTLRSKRTRSNTSGPQAPARKRGSTNDDSRLTRLLQYTFDIVSSVTIVALIGALLFATSGVWPPLVAIESPSMEPHIDTGDLVFVMDEQRFAGPGAIGESGVVPARAGEKTGYRTFEGYGDVIIYEPDGNDEATPIIHRAMFWVESGENWYDRADSAGVGGADNCEELANCPASHAGFITRGDNTVSNKRYDQAMGISEPVKPEWVIGTAEYGVPGLGQVRLLSGEVRSTNVTATTATNATSGTDVTTSANSINTAPATPTP